MDGPALYVNQLDGKKMRNGYFFSNKLHQELNQANSKHPSPLKDLEKYYESKKQLVDKFAGTPIEFDKKRMATPDQKKDEIETVFDHIESELLT